jgi:hypothetical protein
VLHWTQAVVPSADAYLLAAQAWQVVLATAPLAVENLPVEQPVQARLLGAPSTVE